MKNRILFIKLLSVFFTTYMSSCSNKINDIIEFKQLQSEYPIVIRYYEETPNVCSIDYRVEYEICKHTLFKNIRTGLPRFIDNRTGDISNRILPLYMDHDTLMFKDNINLSFFRKEKIVFDITLFYDETDSNYFLLKPYIEKIIISDEDSIHIGTIADLKREDSLFLTEFMQADSIVMDFYYDKLFHPLFIPVEIK